MPADFSLSGHVREQGTGRPLAGLVVRAHDRDLHVHDLLGSATTADSGEYHIAFAEAELREVSERSPDLVLTVFDPDLDQVVHIGPGVIRWKSGGEQVHDLELPRQRRPGDTRSELELLDSHGRRVEEVEAAESILLAADGLAPDSHHRVRIVDDGGEEVLTATLLSDRYGRIEPTVIWPDVGIGDPEEGGRYAFAGVVEAAEALGGRRFVLELDTGDRQRRTADFVVTKELTRPRLLPTDADGRLQRGVLAGRDDLHVSGRNLPAGALVDLYLVARQFDWRAGDPFTPALGADGAEAVFRVELGPDETRFHTRLWDPEQAVPGSYDLIARTVVPHEFRADDRRLRRTDLVSERLMTTLVVRTDIYAYKPVLMGCVMAQEIAGRLHPGPPYFRFTDNFPKGTDVWAALDPAGLMPTAVGRQVRISVVAHKLAADWAATPTFTAVPGTGAEIVTTAGCINGNRALVWSSPQQAGHYDLVVDFGNNAPDPANFVADGSFDPPIDMIDGYFTIGFHVTDDPSVAGPLSVGSTSYNEPAVTISAAGTWLPIAPYVVGNTPSGTFDLPLKAIVRYPATAAGFDSPISAVEPTWPVVMVSPGMGLTHTGYTYLLEHLASHGFVAVAIDVTELNDSIQWGGSFDSRAHAALAHLALLRSKHQNPGLFQGKLDLTRIVVMGHSRGGDGALATAVFNQALGLGWGIKGVVSLAPTDWSGTGPAPLTLSAGAYLGIHGSNDGDVGQMAGVPFATGFNGLAFRAYDRATTEKAMVLVRDATHNLFNTDASSEHGASYPGAIQLTRLQHEVLLCGYVTAFAQWHLHGRTEQRAYFTGELRIPAVEGIEVHNQYRSSPGQVRTLDSFQSAPSVSSNTLGGTVTGSSLAVLPVEDALAVLDRNTPHQTRGLRLRWSNSAGRYESGIPLGSNRNVSAYSTLSFRVSQTVGYLDEVSDSLANPPPFTISISLDAGTVSTGFRDKLAWRNIVTFGPTPTVTTLVAGSRWRIVDGGTTYRVDKVTIGPVAFQSPPAPPTFYDVISVRLEGPSSNPTGQPQDLYVRLATAGGGPARSIRAGYFSPIPFPLRPVKDPVQPLWDEARTLAAMKTIRIPLNAWTIKCLSAPIVDLANVESVTFELSATGSGELLIDDIEFTA